MAKVSGVVCDRCGKFMKDSDVGRITLQVQTNHGNPADHFDICGNTCLTLLGLARAEFEGVNIPGVYFRSSKDRKRNVSQEGLAAMSRNARHIQHKRNHKENPREDCEWCLEEMTSPES